MEVKADSLKQKQALALKEAWLKAENEELDIKTALGMLTAKVKMYDSYEVSEKDDAIIEYIDADST